MTVLVHLTDLHIRPAGSSVNGVDTAASFERVASEVEKLELPVAAIVVSGDLTDSGDPASYRRLRALVDDLLVPLGAPVLPVIGNHDDRGSFLRHYLGIEPVEADLPFCYVHDLPDVRVVLCDSNVPGRTWGRLGSAQLTWLEEQLASSGGRPNVVVLHHPCVPRAFLRVDEHLLRDAHLFADVVRRHHVAAILCGHSHVSTSAVVGGALHVASPATAYLLDPGRGTVDRRYEGSGFGVCTIREGRAVVHPHVLPGAGRTLASREPALACDTALTAGPVSTGNVRLRPHRHWTVDESVSAHPSIFRNSSTR